MTKSRKKKRNKYKESRIRVFKAKVRQNWLILAIFAGFFLVVFLSAGMSRLYHALLEAQWLKVEEIEIAGLKKLDRGRVLDAIGVGRGECILNLRMGAIAERLKEIPTVATASVRLDLPGRLVVELAEREPVAIVQTGGGELFLVDETGMLFARAELEEGRRLPLMTGLCGPKAGEGDFIPAPRFQRAKELISALDGARNWLAPRSISSCRWSPAGFTLVLGERNIPVGIGQEEFSKKLARLRKVISTLTERQWTELVTGIDLDYPGKAYLDGNFPVPKAAPGQKKQAG